MFIMTKKTLHVLCFILRCCHNVFTSIFGNVFLALRLPLNLLLLKGRNRVSDNRCLDI
ncbi:hypothetical protein FGAF374_08950 [Escherichia coli]|nr:hypothetical protein ExPECSC048_00616 [Escherichia coli]CAK0667200.1 hypothetical protein FGAF1022_22320 [Escherichia coli]CAK0669814.1 hypothetical protein FGAF374_08950 [Escherichia coli]SRB29032.1 Uncharacterised protein [Escherichia coli]